MISDKFCPYCKAQRGKQVMLSMSGICPECHGHASDYVVAPREAEGDDGRREEE